MRSGNVPRLTETELAEALAVLRTTVSRGMGAGLRGHESPSDIVQSAFREFLELVNSGKVTEAVAPGQRHGLLSRLALHKIIDRVRYHRVRQRHRERKLLQPHPATTEREQDPASIQLVRERIERLRLAMAKLPSSYRDIIALAYFDRLPHAEIAERLGRSVEASRMLLSRALTRLAKLLQTGD